MTQQNALFDDAPYRTESSTVLSKPKPPMSGVKWRRTALRRDCGECWRKQHKEYSSGRSLYAVRRRADAELQMWDDDGCLSLHEFYCALHAEELGWSSARSYDTKRRRDTEAEFRTALGFRFNSLIGQAKSSPPAGFSDSIEQLVRHAGGAGLEMPEWTVTHAGVLRGKVYGRVFNTIREWAECWRADIFEEAVSHTELLVSADCQILNAPLVQARIYGYAAMK